MSFTLITITYSGEQPDSTYANGTITATLNEPIENAGLSIDATTMVGTLNEGQLVNRSGQPFQLVANDDTGTSPEGSYYSFTLDLDSAPIDHFDAVVSHSVEGATVDISTLRESPGLPA